MRDCVGAECRSPIHLPGDAEVMVMGRHGYEVAVKGKNGFVCMVERGWTAGVDDPVFWNQDTGSDLLQPTGRAVQCSHHGQEDRVGDRRDDPKSRPAEAIKGRFRQEGVAGDGAWCRSAPYCPSRGTVNDSDGHWRPHLMFFVPDTDPTNVGRRIAELSGYRNQGHSGPVHVVSQFRLADSRTERLPRWMGTELFVRDLAAGVNLEYRDFRRRENAPP